MSSPAKLLDNEEINTILQTIIKQEQLQNPEIETSSGCNKGDGFLSAINKITIQADNKSLNLIFKCAPRSKEFRKRVPLHELFKREETFYKTVFPEFIKFQQEHNVTDIFNNVPKVYNASSDLYKEIVVMEDIRVQGFEMFDRMKLMDDEHVTLVMKKFGELHAISFAMQDQNLDLYEEITKDMDGIWHNFGLGFSKTVKSNVNQAADLYNGEGEEKERNALLKLEDEVIDVIMNMKKTKHNAVIHGDCWCNNIMFKYQAGKLVDMRFLDFQLSRTATPAYELSYFLYISCGKEIHNKLEYYLNIYYDSLKARTKAMGSDIEKLYPYSALMDDFKIYGKFGFILGLCIVKASMKDDEENEELLDENSEEGDFAIPVDKLKNKNIIKERLKDLCSFVVENGFI